MALDSGISQRLIQYQPIDKWIKEKLDQHEKAKLTAKAVNSFLNKKKKKSNEYIKPIVPVDREALNAIELARLKWVNPWPSALDPVIYWGDYTMTWQPNFQTIDWWLVNPLTQKIIIAKPILTEEEKKRKRLNSFEDIMNYDFPIGNSDYT